MTLPEEDLQIEYVKPVQPGGQHVGLPNPAIRVIHLPTGIKIEVGCERSQTRNKKLALSMLEWGLAEIYPL